jgi:hypothetical protein
MSRAPQIGAVLWLAMASSLVGQTIGFRRLPTPGRFSRLADHKNRWSALLYLGQADGQPKPKPALAPPPRAASGIPKAGGGRILNPGNPVLRMMAMPPERREQMLERLPPQQQVRLRQALENFDKLPPAERSRQLGILNMYANLPPEKQATLTTQIQLFNHLPDERIAVLRPELLRLHRMPGSARSDRIASEEFKSKFTPEEQKILAEISPYFPFSIR